MGIFSKIAAINCFYFFTYCQKSKMLALVADVVALRLVFVGRILAEGRGPWLYSFLSAVDASIVEKHRLLILEMMQEAVICTAQSRGFVGILSLHSHPATTVSVLHRQAFSPSLIS